MTDAFRALADELLLDGPVGWRLLAADLRDRGSTGKVEGAAQSAWPDPKKALSFPSKRLDGCRRPSRTLVEVENTNHYDILYFAPKTTVDAIHNFLTRL